MPTLRELGAAVVHLKWFSLQIIGPTVWLQAPVLVFDAFDVSGRDIASFLLIRTMVNQIQAGLSIRDDRRRNRNCAAGSSWGFCRRLEAFGADRPDDDGALRHHGRRRARVRRKRHTLLGRRRDAVLASESRSVLLAPLLAIVFLQQPVALLQYANMSLAPGLQRLLQIVLGPLMCIAGQKFYGVSGLVAGLAVSEVLANWALAPLLANMRIFSAFWRYCLSSAAAGLVALAASLALGVGLMRLFPSPSLGVLAMNMAIWSVLTIVPMMLITLPEPVRHVAAAAPASGPSESRGILRQRCSSGCQRRFGPSPIPPIFSCCWHCSGSGCSGPAPRGPDARCYPWSSPCWC